MTTSASKSILIVDDDPAFASTLATILERRGLRAVVAGDVGAAIAHASARPPDYAVVDLRLPGASGLMVVKRLRQISEQTRVVVLTGFGSIASTVDAMKLGAVHYLTKPATADQILAALEADEEPEVAEGEVEMEVPSVYRVEWEHIQRVLAEQNGNVSEAARVLGIHRRTLQRKLSKRPVRR